MTDTPHAEYTITWALRRLEETRADLDALRAEVLKLTEENRKLKEELAQWQTAGSQ